LYAVQVGPALHYALELGVFLIAAACTVLALRHRDTHRAPPFLAFGWVWFVWFLAAPYGHVHDEILLAAPIVGLMGRDAWRLPRRLRQLSERSTSVVGYVAPLLVPYLMFASILGLVRFPVQIASIPLIGAAICFAVVGGRFLTSGNEASRTHEVSSYAPKPSPKKNSAYGDGL
jgi:hypothetical protein